MRHDARTLAAIEILSQLHDKWAAHGRTPADGLLADYYKTRRFIGSKDRAYISELVYYALRYGGSLQWWLEQQAHDVTPRSIILLSQLFLHQLDLSACEEIFSGNHYAPAGLNRGEIALIEACASQDLLQEAMPEWARYNAPEWIIPDLKQRFGDAFDAEMRALNEQAPVDLRVNTLKCADRGDLIVELDREQLYAAPTLHSPLGIRLRDRAPITGLDIFKKGWFEVQDEGSQILAALIEAEAGQKVIDFCAGAGGKTLAIAAHMENKGRLLAWDISESRLKQLRKRLSRAGVDNVIIQPLKSETDPHIKRHKESADWVIIDAPCSGTGTWRRNPDMKWRTSRNDIQEVIALQQAILESACRTVKKDGMLIYATCSLLDSENHQQVKSFLVEHPEFVLEPIPEMWNNLTLNVEGLGTFLQTSPHKDGTDGFFAAIMRRVEAP